MRPPCSALASIGSTTSFGAEAPHDERPQPEQEARGGRNDHDAQRIDADAGAEAVIARDGKAQLMQEIDQRRAGRRPARPRARRSRRRRRSGSARWSAAGSACGTGAASVPRPRRSPARTGAPRPSAQRSPNSPSFPRRPDHRPLRPYPSPIFWAILRRVPTWEIFHGSGRNPAGPAAGLGHGDAAARPFARRPHRLGQSDQSGGDHHQAAGRPRLEAQPQQSAAQLRVRARSPARRPSPASTTRWCAGGRAT